LLGINAGTGNGFLHYDASEFAGIKISQGTTKGTDRGTNGTQNDYISAHKTSLYKLSTSQIGQTQQKEQQNPQQRGTPDEPDSGLHEILVGNVT
jgi:hypothetical protein